MKTIKLNLALFGVLKVVPFTPISCYWYKYNTSFVLSHYAETYANLATW